MSGHEGVMLTSGGRHVYPLDLNPNDIAIEDIAYALSHVNRYTGHAGGYSVAEHSVRVAEAIEAGGWAENVVLWGLLHDASEAYLGDVSRTQKHSGEYAAYREAEARAMKAIAVAFHLAPSGEPSIVKDYDRILLATERRDLLPPVEGIDLGFEPYLEGVEPLDEKIVPWTAEEARERFLAMYESLAPMGTRVLSDVVADAFADFGEALRGNPKFVENGDALGVERETVLQEADRLVSHDRQTDYGHPLDDFTKVTEAARALGIDPIRGGAEHHALYMVVVKLARETNRPKRDNRVDGAGYFKTADMVIEERARRADEALRSSDPTRYAAEVDGRS